MSKPSNLPPRVEGFYLFHGMRQSRPGYVEILHEPVSVIVVQNGSKTELAVTLCGRATKYPLRQFVIGTWKVIAIEEAT